MLIIKTVSYAKEKNLLNNLKNMEKEKFLLLLVFILAGSFILFVNLTRVVWKSTETGIDEKQQIACLEGGGKKIINDFGEFLRCERPN